MPLRQRAFDDLYTVGARLGRELRGDFERHDIKADRGQHGGRIAGAGADDERALTGFEPHFGKQLAKNGRRDQEAAVADRDRPIDISQGPRRLGHEALARDAAHRFNHGRIAHALRTKLAFDHCRARRGEVRDGSLHRHNCYMPLIHLEFKLLNIGRGPTRQPPLIERWSPTGRGSTSGGAIGSAELIKPAYPGAARTPGL